jgi:hypothetical protein
VRIVFEPEIVLEPTLGPDGFEQQRHDLEARFLPRLYQFQT